ncbi:hypothetical protein Tco_1516156 [Tanacetum coccineum]
MVRVKENVSDVVIQITSLVNVRIYQETKIKGRLLENLGAIAVKMRKKRLRTKHVFVHKHPLNLDWEYNLEARRVVSKVDRLEYAYAVYPIPPAIPNQSQIIWEMVPYEAFACRCGAGDVVLRESYKHETVNSIWKANAEINFSFKLSRHLTFAVDIDRRC